MYKIVIDEERGCIMGMREGGMKSLDTACVLNVPQSIVSTILTKKKVGGSVKSQCGRHRKSSDRDASVGTLY
jgi:hypothetical protein